MNRKILALNLVLVVLLGWLGMRLRASWQEARARQEEIRNRPVKAAPVVPPPALPGAAPATAGEYLNVAQQMLFSADRNPTEIIRVEEAPPPPPKPKPPAFPNYHGQMAFGEPVIVLSTAQSPQKSYRAGEEVGEFKIASFDREKVTFTWNDETLEAKLRDLVPKEAERPRQADATAQTAAPERPAVASIGASTQAKADPDMGDQRGAYRDCLLTDKSPNGTVKDGYRKVMSQTLMGESCHWEPIH